MNQKATKTPIVPVILCGGAGTRLWPLSRKNFPKPFLKIGEKSLISQTVQRASQVCRVNDSQDILLVSNEAYQFLLRDECEPLLKSSVGDLQLHQLLEPEGRNTASAIYLAALWARDKYPDQDPVLLVLPADHLIHPIDEFVAVCSQAVTLAQKGQLTCFGINPTAPETGFGYIKKGVGLEQAGFAVDRFVEKPDQETALQYLASGQYLWNGGMFAFACQALLKAMREHCEPLSTQADSVWACAQLANESNATKFDSELFALLPDISIDYALMEKANNVAVVPCAFQWSDIGSFAALAQQCQANENMNSTQVLEPGGQWIDIDSSNTHVTLSGRTVATLGLKDCLVIDTPDALLVADKSRTQEVKKVVEQLKAQASDLVNFHPTVHRPWGTYTVLEDSSGYKIKRIEVKQGAALSLQMHHHRSEHWIVVSGTAEVTNGDQTFLVRKNESTYIPAGHKHRLINPGVMPLVMIEVQSGDYLEEDDIVRFDDIYGRG